MSAGVRIHCVVPLEVYDFLVDEAREDLTVLSKHTAKVLKEYYLEKKVKKSEKKC